MPYAVAATAWTQLVGCKEFKGAATLDVIRDFRDQFLGQGPEGQFPAHRLIAIGAREAPGGAHGFPRPPPCTNPPRPAARPGNGGAGAILPLTSGVADGV